MDKQLHDIDLDVISHTFLIFGDVIINLPLNRKYKVYVYGRY